MQTKMCQGCLERLPVSDFRKDKSRTDGFSLRCKSCLSIKDAAYRAANKAKISEYGQRYRATHPRSPRVPDEHSRARDFMRRNSVTVDEYEALLNEQGGRCAICGTDQPGRAGRKGTQNRFAVDHNPTSNLVRGLLCHSCNRALGLLQDSEEILEKAISYIRRSRS